LLILGVRPWAHTTSWVLTSMLSFVFITFLMSVVLQNILQHTPFSLIWFWMGLFSMAAMSFCFFLASFFSKAKLAAVIGPMALFASLLPRFVFFGTNRYEAIAGKYFASLLPGTALAFGADIVGDYEYGEQNVGQSMWVGDYSFGSSLSFLLFDTFLYMFLAWYTEQVIPREYGAAPKPWYFIFACCCPRSWFARSQHKAVEGDEEEDDDDSVDALKKSTNECIEPVNDPALVPRVIINNLVKRYNKKQVKPSVNHLNLTLYESQITALLGHNGEYKGPPSIVL
jgi:ATP-binding cassette, subfamily A (ABC1), member 3